MRRLKIHIIEYTPPLLLVYFIFIGSISNYSVNYIALKCLSFFLPLLILSDIQVFLRLTPNKFVLIIILLICLLTSAFFSLNPSHGFLKVLLIFVSYTPLIIISMLVFFDKQNFIRFVHILIIIASLASLISIVIAPFNQSTTYVFSFNRWSHVVFSRMIGLALLSNIYLLLNEPRHKQLLPLSSILLSIGLVYSGARGAFLAVILSSLFLLILNRTPIVRKVLISLPVIGAILLGLLFTIYSGNERIVDTGRMILSSKNIDSSLQTRIAAFELSFKMWMEAPFFGNGLGGFNSFYETNLPQKILYPHNIILEILCELGIFGFLLFLFFIVSIFRKIWSLNHEFITFFIYGICLSMFSKDLTSNPLVFIFSFILLLNTTNKGELLD